MTVLQVMRGKPVVNIKELCEHYQISDRTARTIVKELEAQKERYGDYTIMGEGALRRINFLAFTDYYRHRTMLKETNARKYVPPYNPQEVARSLGMYGKDIL